MNTEYKGLKKGALVALGSLFALLILAIVYYRERVLFADAAFVSFNIITSGHFEIQFGRYGSFFTQLLPYLGTHLQLSVSTIVFLYGISFNLLYCSAIALIIFKCRQYSLAILMALYYCLFFSESFIWISEIPQGIAWMFLLFGVTLHLGHKKTNVAWLLLPFAVLAFLALYTHFVIILPTFFIWIYLIIEQKNWPFTAGKTILLTSILVSIIVMKFIFAMSNASSGDGPLLHNVTHFSIKDIIESFSKPEVLTFFERCRTNYWWGIIVFIISIVSLIRNKQKMLLAWTVISVLGYIIIMGLTYGGLDGNTKLFHIESEWTCIGIIIATPFCFSFLPGAKPLFTISLLSAIFIVRIAYIVSMMPAFTARIDMNERILAQMRKKGITKLGVTTNQDLNAVKILDWGIPYESLLLSAMAQDKPVKTFSFVNPDNKVKMEEIATTTSMNTVWGIVPKVYINYKYFNIDTVNTYRIMSYEELFR